MQALQGAAPKDNLKTDLSVIKLSLNIYMRATYKRDAIFRVFFGNPCIRIFFSTKTDGEINHDDGCNLQSTIEDCLKQK